MQEQQEFNVEAKYVWVLSPREAWMSGAIHKYKFLNDEHADCMENVS